MDLFARLISPIRGKLPLRAPLSASAGRWALLIIRDSPVSPPDDQPLLGAGESPFGPGLPPAGANNLLCDHLTTQPTCRLAMLHGE